MTTPEYEAVKYTPPTGAKRVVDKTFDFWSSTPVLAGGVTETFTVVTDTKTEHVPTGSADEMTHTVTCSQKTRELTYEKGRLTAISVETGWTITSSYTFTTCCGEGGEECPCDPGYPTIWLALFEPDQMDPFNNPGNYTTFEMAWQGHPDCNYVAADGSSTPTLTFDVNANGMSGAWILSLTPSHTAGLWDENVPCDPFIGSYFYDADDANGLTYVEILENDPGP